MGRLVAHPVSRVPHRRQGDGAALFLARNRRAAGPDLAMAGGTTANRVSAAAIDGLTNHHDEAAESAHERQSGGRQGRRRLLGSRGRKRRRRHSAETLPVTEGETPRKDPNGETARVLVGQGPSGIEVIVLDSDSDESEVSEPAAKRHKSPSPTSLRLQGHATSASPKVFSLK